jgi:hypothetical protein
MHDDDDDEAAEELEFLACQRAVAVKVKPKARARRGPDQFVKVPLWWAEQAARATVTPKAFVWIWLLHLAWKAKSNTFTVSNEQLLAFNVSRYAKYRALRELEEARLIQVVRDGAKSPVVTLLYN